ncbi:hypothetical protein SVAN01_00035 [Stagonosporopsis vannaccii]|nr:hypothetical protein SVAN01_00035 [Stagonosporopsis vannaccii]
MKCAFVSVAFSLGANALVARQNSQCIQLKASGEQSGVLGQLDDGQNRIGGDNAIGCYCLNGDGAFTDSKGRGCILTPPTAQFQCDVGASPATGFKVDDNGSVTHDGDSKFYACPASDTQYNVYTTPVEGQDKCVEISLESAGSCGAGSGKPSAPAASQPAKSTVAPQPSQPASKPSQPAPEVPKESEPGYPAQSQPAPKPSQSAQSQPAPKPSQSASMSSQPAPKPSQPAPEPAPEVPKESEPGYPAQSQPAPKPSQPAQSAPAPRPSAPAQSAPAPAPSVPAQSGDKCPTDLNGEYQYPHLIIPVDSEQPSKAFGTSYNGKTNSHTCSIFNFDIPVSYSGKTCSTVFLFPKQKDLETSSFTVSGSGKVSFTKLKSPASQQTSHDNQPGKASDLASMSIAPGNSYAISSEDCAAGQTISYEICSEGDFDLDYFQDYNPSPIGLYVRQC